MRLEDIIFEQNDILHQRFNSTLYRYLKLTSNEFQEKLLIDACFGC